MTHLFSDKDYSDYNNTINISKSVTIDGNNHSISLNDNSSFRITENNLSLTFKNITFINNFRGLNFPVFSESCCMAVFGVKSFAI